MGEGRAGGVRRGRAPPARSGPPTAGGGRRAAVGVGGPQGRRWPGALQARRAGLLELAGVAGRLGSGQAPPASRAGSPGRASRDRAGNARSLHATARRCSRSPAGGGAPGSRVGVDLGAWGSVAVSGYVWQAARGLLRAEKSAECSVPDRIYAARRRAASCTWLATFQVANGGPHATDGLSAACCRRRRRARRPRRGHRRPGRWGAGASDRLPPAARRLLLATLLWTTCAKLTGSMRLMECWAVFRGCRWVGYGSPGSDPPTADAFLTAPSSSLASLSRLHRAGDVVCVVLLGMCQLV